MKINKLITTIIVVLCCIGSIHFARIYFGPHGRVTLDPRIANRLKGNPSASVWVVEYMDYQCPSCRLATKILEAYFEEYPSNLYLQVKFHPLKQHLHGLETTVYAECATRQNKFWKFHHLLFEHQDEWKEITDTTDIFHRYAQETGMDIQKLDACLLNPLTKETVLRENEESLALGVNSTPSFFINGKMVVGTRPFLAELKTISPGFNYELPEENHAH